MLEVWSPRITPDISKNGIEAQAANKYMVEKRFPKSLPLHKTETAVGHRDKNPEMEEP